jgi:REP element-mobilizing transposase RayT
MVTRWYAELENKFRHMKCHQSVVMPNHFHCIIEIITDNNNSDVDTRMPQKFSQRRASPK